MIQLNLPEYNFSIKEEGNKQFILDKIRKKYVHLTPEEWVRQNFIRYLIEEKFYPLERLSVEKQIKVNNRIKRADIVFFDKTGQAEFIVECKAPTVALDEKTLMQAANYNLFYQCRYVFITNGLQHISFYLDRKSKSINMKQDIPDYNPGMG